MVRLLKVKELEDRKRLVLARSEMYRQTLKLEVANVRFSAALWKRKLKSPKSMLILLGLAAVPTAGIFLARRHAKPKVRDKAKQEMATGVISAAIAGWNLFKRFGPVLKRLRRPVMSAMKNGRQNVERYP